MEKQRFGALPELPDALALLRNAQSVLLHLPDLQPLFQIAGGAVVKPGSDKDERRQASQVQPSDSIPQGLEGMSAGRAWREKSHSFQRR
jgi:hypothetical protein